MIKVIFTNTASGTGFSADFNTKEAALDACKWYMGLHANNDAQPFYDCATVLPMNVGEKEKKAKK